jgi:cell shape-determining protein MreC
VQGIPDRPTREQYQTLYEENEQLRRQIAHQQVAIDEMHRRFADVTGLRDQLRDMRGMIVLAPVVSFDASPRRESMLIGRGSNQIAGLRVGLWVAGAPELGHDEPISGRERLARQVIIGRISEVHPFTSRVQLITDPGFQNIPVRTARVLEQGTWQVVGPELLISGLGSGRMWMDRVPEDVYGAGARVVLFGPTSELPAAMTLGRIESSRSRPDAPLFFDLDVRPWYTLNEISNVYVIVPGSVGRD